MCANWRVSKCTCSMQFLRHVHMTGMSRPRANPASKPRRFVKLTAAGQAPREPGFEIYPAARNGDLLAVGLRNQAAGKVAHDEARSPDFGDDLIVDTFDVFLPVDSKRTISRCLHGRRGPLLVGGFQRLVEPHRDESPGRIRMARPERQLTVNPFRGRDIQHLPDVPNHAFAAAVSGNAPGQRRLPAAVEMGR